MRLVATDHRGVNAYFVRNDLAAEELPEVQPSEVWRLLDKHQEQVSEGMDVYALIEEHSLELAEV